MANVLLVDDEPDFVAAAKEMLQLHGHTVESAERLESARRLLGGAVPDGPEPSSSGGVGTSGTAGGGFGRIHETTIEPKSSTATTPSETWIGIST